MLRIAIAQTNLLVGDIEGNATLVIQQAQKAKSTLNADLIVFPELTITGYPPEDLLLRKELYPRVEQALDKIKASTTGIDVILGYPEKTLDGCYNSAALIRNGEVFGRYHKQKLPNYSVFDEKRYFKPGTTPCIVTVRDIPIALSICEDLWHPEPMQAYAAAGAKLAISLNASPFHMDQANHRRNKLIQRVKEARIPIVYVNQVGGQDELVFDGGSLAMDQNGEVLVHAGYFEEKLLPVDFETIPTLALQQGNPPPHHSEEKKLYDALVLGVRDYIEKNNFPGVVIGLSGGIDSALTLAIAVDAIGKDRVEAIMMPSQYTSEMSSEDAKTQAESLGINYRVLPIEPLFQEFLATLADEFAGLPADITEENIQARCRGMLLMAISNKKHLMVLSTSNKSETAMGYSTLYGDMVGGFAVLKDVSKTWVYRLANHRNTISPVIPQRAITRPPSAELTHNQMDQDVLPPYEVLDEILERYIEQDQSTQEIIEAGFDKETVELVVQQITRNEYKRRQAPPGVRTTRLAFGRDRRYPITSGFYPGIKN